MNGKVMIPDIWLYQAQSEPQMQLRKKLLDYVKSIGSWLCSRPDLMRLVADECIEHGVNPAYVLALMQKEQSALWRGSAPSQRAQDWLLGYGCPEDKARAEQYRGADKQIAHAVYQLRRYAEASKVFPQVKGWRKAGPVKLYDSAAILRQYGVERTVKPDSMAEAASLLYNPRIEGLALQAKFIKRVLDGMAAVVV